MSIGISSKGLTESSHMEEYVDQMCPKQSMVKKKKGFIFSTKTLHIIPKRKYCLKRRQMWAGLVLHAADRLKVGWSVDVIGNNPEPSRDNTERESCPKKQ